MDYSKLKNQKDWKAYIQALIKNNDKAVERAILAIYEKQTIEEQQKLISIENNKAGFGKIDAKEMGELALKLKNGEKLSESELAKSRNKMMKYWKQLMRISKVNLGLS